MDKVWVKVVVAFTSDGVDYAVNANAKLSQETLDALPPGTVIPLSRGAAANQELLAKSKNPSGDSA